MVVKRHKNIGMKINLVTAWMILIGLVPIKVQGQGLNMLIHRQEGIVSLKTDCVDSIKFASNSDIGNEMKYGNSLILLDSLVKNFALFDFYNHLSACDYLGEKESPLKGKLIFCLGDSHVESSKICFLDILSDLTLCHFHKLTKKATMLGGPHFFIDDEDTGVSPNCDGYNWCQYVYVIGQYCKKHEIPLDYLFIENCHFDKWKEDENSITYLGDSPTYPRVFQDASEASTFFRQELPTILKDLRINSAKNASFRLRYKTRASCSLNFSFGDVDNLNSDVTITISFPNGRSISSNLTRGMSIEECVDALNQWDFSSYSNWTNPNKGIYGYDYISLVYTGDGNPSEEIIAIEISDSSNLTT